MANIIFSIALCLISVFATWFYARRYFNKGIRTKELSIELIDYSYLIPSLESNNPINKLTIQYDNKQIERLVQLVFQIKNTGNISISNYKKSLSLMLPDDFYILEDNIEYHPEGRIIELSQKSRNHCTIDFDILNSEESFQIKLLCSSEESSEGIRFSENIENVSFHISCEELPSKIPVINGTRIISVDKYNIQLVEEKVAKDFEWMKKALLSVKILAYSFIFIGIVYFPILFLIGDFGGIEYNVFNEEFYSEFEFNKVFIFIAWVTSFFLTFNSIYVFFTWKSNYKVIKTTPNKP